MPAKRLCNPYRLSCNYFTTLFIWAAFFRLLHQKRYIMPSDTVKKNTARRVRDEAKYEHAWLLFSQQIPQQEIARKVGIAERTLSRWVNENDWINRRAAINVTRDELVNKTLGLINTLLEKATTQEGGNGANLADQLSKLAGAIRNLDKQANVVDIVQVFMTFNKWLICQQPINSELTDEIIRTINRYQDMFISEKLSLQKQ